MKIYNSILTSASSGAWNWSSAYPIWRHAKNGFFNLTWNITGDASGVTFAYSGCSVENGNFITSSTTDYITTSGTSISGPAGDGKDFSGFSPPVFPYIKIGAWAWGTTTALTANLIVD